MMESWNDGCGRPARHSQYSTIPVFQHLHLVTSRGRDTPIPGSGQVLIYPFSERNAKVILRFLFTKMRNPLRVHDHSCSPAGARAARQLRLTRQCCVCRVVGAGGECGRSAMYRSRCAAYHRLQHSGRTPASRCRASQGRTSPLSKHGRAGSPPVPIKR